MNDRYDLERFVKAQDRIYSEVVAELESGVKRGHWIWYIFPQVRGLSHSQMARRYAMSSIDEAAAYSEHSQLGPRLLQCTELVLAVEGKPVEQIFGHPDYLKFRSCMTLFARASNNDIFQIALDKYFDGLPDSSTFQALEKLKE